MVVPDYTGFEYSSMPNTDQFEYTFDNLALIISKLINKLGLNDYTSNIQDYSAPVAFRIAVKNYMEGPGLHGLLPKSLKPDQINCYN